MSPLKKKGCECVVHMLQSVRDINREVTVTSIGSVRSDFLRFGAREGEGRSPHAFTSCWASIRPSLNPQQGCSQAIEAHKIVEEASTSTMAWVQLVFKAALGLFGQQRVLRVLAGFASS